MRTQLMRKDTLHGEWLLLCNNHLEAATPAPHCQVPDAVVLHLLEGLHQTQSPPAPSAHKDDSPVVQYLIDHARRQNNLITLPIPTIDLKFV